MQKVILNIQHKGSWINRLFNRLLQKRYELMLPSTWTEIPSKLIHPCMKVLMYRSFDTHKTCLNILRVFIPIKKTLFFSINPIDFLEKLIPCVEWMLNTPMIDPVIPVITFQKKQFYLPKRAFLNVTIGEYIEAENIYTRVSEGEYEAVTDLTAVLLREKNTNTEQIRMHDDIRVPLDSYSWERRKQMFLNLDPVLSFYVLNFYLHCKQYLHDGYKLVFESDSKKKDSNSSGSWEDILTDVAETGVFGNRSQLLQVNIHVFFTWMLKNKRRYQKQQQESLQQMIKQNHKKFLA